MVSRNAAMAFMACVATLGCGLGLVSAADESPATVPDSTRERPRIVIVEGVGADVEDARRDAYRQAVRQVLGAIVDSQTLVENDRLITEKVVVFSNGFIERVEPLPDGEAREKSGLVRLRLKAFVRAGKLVEALRSNAITVAASEVAIDDADSLLARVTTTRERDREARELFLTAATSFPASCFQAEAYPLTDSNVRLEEDVVVCDVRVKVVARPKEYDEFAKRLITFVETLPPEAQQTIRLPAPSAIGKSPRATLINDVQLLFPDTAIARAFDRVGNNPLLDLGERTPAWGGEAEQRKFEDEVRASGFERRTGRFGFRLCVISTACTPYDAYHFFLDREKLDWFGALHGCVRCEIDFRRDGKSVAKASTRLRNFGVAVEPRFFDLPDWGEAIVRRKEPLTWANVVPGYGTLLGRLFGPMCELTIPVRVPAAAFTRGLQLRCRLVNHAHASP